MIRGKLPALDLAAVRLIAGRRLKVSNEADMWLTSSL
jgi:hypothetical protein